MRFGNRKRSSNGAARNSAGCGSKSRNFSDHPRPSGLEVASSGFRVGQPYACKKRNAVPNNGTKIRELSRWYRVNGTWASSIVAKGTPRGRVRNVHSPVAVHRSYAIVSGTAIVGREGTHFNGNGDR